MVGLPLACLRRGSLASLACFRHAYRGSLSRGQWQQHWQLPVLRAAQNGRLFFSDYKNETDRYNSEEHGLDNGVGNEYNKVGTPPTLEAQSNKSPAPASQLYSNPAWEAMEEACKNRCPPPRSIIYYVPPEIFNVENLLRHLSLSYPGTGLGARA